nr:hypothetical protein [uncultured Dethiosulfovibrio sp.]
MDQTTIKMIVNNGHFIGYGLNHKKKVRKTVMTAQAIADRLSQRSFREYEGFIENRSATA